MPDVTPESVAEAVRARWEDSAALAGIVPADRVYVGRAGEKKVSPTWPYAVLTVTQDGRDQRTTGGVYLRRFRVQVEAYTIADPPVSDDLRQELAAALCGTPADWTAGLVVGTADGVVHALPRDGGSVAVTGERHDNKDVVKTVFVSEILLQGHW